jgi:hypothetical protein
MARKKQIGLLGAMALGLATSLGGVQQAQALVPATQSAKQQENKEGIAVEKKIIKPVSRVREGGGLSGVQNPYKHIRRGGMNQRQYRKWLRSNPNMRKTRKVKSR